jgi:hypothetical protein
MIGTLKFEDHVMGTVTQVACIHGAMKAADVAETLRYVATDSLERDLSKIERRARQVLLDAGHDPDKPGLVPEPLEQGSLLYDCHILLRYISIFRSEVSNDPFAAISPAMKIASIATAHDLLVDHGQAIRRGRKFINGPKAKRMDKLAREIIKGFRKLGPNASAHQLLAFVKQNRDFEVEADDSILWTSGAGEPRTTIFKTFRNRISKLRPRS